MDDKYPDPNVPMDASWIAMKGMLDNGMPISHAHVTKQFKWLKAAKLISVLTLAATGLLYVIIQYQKHDFRVKTKVETHKLIERLGITNSASPMDFFKSTDYPEKVLEATAKHNDENIKQIETRLDNHFGKTDKIVLPENAVSENISSNEKEITTGKRISGQKKALKIKGLATVPNRISEEYDLSKVKQNREGYKPQNTKTEPTRQSHYPTRSRNNTFNSNKGNINPNDNVEGNLPLISGSGYPNKTIVNSLEQVQSVRNSESTALITFENKMQLISFLTIKKTSKFNPLKSMFTAISIKQNAGEISTVKVKERNYDFKKGIHFGLLWNFNLPQSGYDLYFRGTGTYSHLKTNLVSNDFYKSLFPAVYLSKTLKSGSEVLLKVKPYNQYFGRSKPFYNHQTPGDSTYTFNETRSLAKISGLNLGIQYNQFLTNRWSLGVGMSVQWQKSALIRNEFTTTDPRIAIDYVPFASIIQKTDTLNYINPHFITTNVELLYSRKWIQLGAGLVMPITSMTPSPYLKQRPISGQLLLRWRLR